MKRLPLDRTQEFKFKIKLFFPSIKNHNVLYDNCLKIYFELLNLDIPVNAESFCNFRTLKSRNYIFHKLYK